jgi:hypothetical protein
MGHRHPPARTGRGVKRPTAIIDAVRRRLAGDNEVDAWGLDRDVVTVLDPLLALRWAITVSGATFLPLEGPMLLVANRRLGFSEPLVVARALRTATARYTRFASIEELAPIASALRPLGGVLAHPSEIGSLLRTGEMVAVFCDRVARRPGSVGPVPVQLVEPAHALGVPVLPVAVAGRELGRSWSVTVGAPIRAVDPRALALEVRAGVQALLQ